MRRSASARRAARPRPRIWRPTGGVLSRRRSRKSYLAKSIGQALGCLERCHRACKADERKRLETRHRDCEVQAFRRGAAALCACSAGIDAGDEHKHRYLDGFRKLVPGEPHSADDAFVNSLEREQGKVSLWAVASVDGAACVVDVGDSSAYAGAVLAKASVDLSDAATVRQTLVEAMAGASDEARCMAGPPRRPRSIEFHSDLETIAEALRDDLKTAFDVDVVIGKKDAPKRNAFKACRSGDAPPFAAGDAVLRRRPREQAAAQRPRGRRRAVAAGQEALRGHAGGDGRAARDLARAQGRAPLDRRLTVDNFPFPARMAFPPPSVARPGPARTCSVRNGLLGVDRSAARRRSWYCGVRCPPRGSRPGHRRRNGTLRAYAEHTLTPRRL